MENLSNANLLDTTVANANTLKNKRLEKTSMVSGNPNPNPVSNSANTNQLVNNENVVTEVKSEKDYIDTKSIIRNPEIEKSKDEDNKIFGMNKNLFYGLVAIGVIVGGYFVYTKYFKKSGVSKPNLGSSALNNANSLVKN